MSVSLEPSLWVRLGLRLGGNAVTAVASLHLLNLIWGENRGELLHGLLMDSFHLLFHHQGRDCGVVVVQRSEFLIAVGENGFELGRLIRREI